MAGQQSATTGASTISIPEGCDFIDFGCSNGGSMTHALKLFGARAGLGIDIDPAKVAKVSALGLNAVLADASALRFPQGSVSFCMMSHFLEHLPGMTIAQRCLASAVRVAKDFVYIKHPWFDSDLDLYRLGYKFYWSDWRGHTLNIGIAQLDYLLRRIGALEWTLYGIKRVTDLNSPLLVPIDTRYDSGPVENVRPSQRLPFDAFQETAALIRVGDKQTFEATRRMLGGEHVEIGHGP